MHANNPDRPRTQPLAREAAWCARPRPHSAPDPVGAALESAVDALPVGADRSRLVAALAASRLDLVLYRAADWLTAADAAVLLAVPSH